MLCEDWSPDKAMGLAIEHNRLLEIPNGNNSGNHFHDLATNIAMNFEVLRILSFEQLSRFLGARSDLGTRDVENDFGLD